MAEALAAARKARAEMTARQTGIRLGQPHYTIGNHMVGTEQGGISELPTDLSKFKPLQVLDTTSVNLGKFYFLPGYDSPGDPNKVIR
jgi:hypothetical protein